MVKYRPVVIVKYHSDIFEGKEFKEYPEGKKVFSKDIAIAKAEYFAKDARSFGEDARPSIERCNCEYYQDYIK